MSIIAKRKVQMLCLVPMIFGLEHGLAVCLDEMIQLLVDVVTFVFAVLHAQAVLHVLPEILVHGYAALRMLYAGLAACVAVVAAWVPIMMPEVPAEISAVMAYLKFSAFRDIYEKY